MENLIEKIRKLLDTQANYNKQYTFGYEECIEDVLAILKPYKVYDELVGKVSSLWDDMSGDEAELLLSEIKMLLDKIKDFSEK